MIIYTQPKITLQNLAVKLCHIQGVGKPTYWDYNIFFGLCKYWDRIS